MILTFKDKFDLQIVVGRGSKVSTEQILNNNDRKFTKCECADGRLVDFTVYNLAVKQANDLRILLKQANVKTY